MHQKEFPHSFNLFPLFHRNSTRGSKGGSELPQVIMLCKDWDRIITISSASTSDLSDPSVRIWIVLHRPSHSQTREHHVSFKLKINEIRDWHRVVRVLFHQRQNPKLKLNNNKKKGWIKAVCYWSSVNRRCFIIYI